MRALRQFIIVMVVSFIIHQEHSFSESKNLCESAIDQIDDQGAMPLATNLSLKADNSEVKIQKENSLWDYVSPYLKASPWFEGVKLAKWGFRFAFAPLFVLYDPFSAFVDAAGSKYMSAQPAETIRGRLLQIMVPFKLRLYKLAVSYVGYVLLLAGGVNAPAMIADRPLFPEELARMHQVGAATKENELIVFVGTSEEPGMVSQVFGKIASDAKTKFGIAQNQIVFIETNDAATALEEIGKAGKKGKIAEVVFLAHGMAGSFDFDESTKKDVTNPSGILSTQRLEELSSIIDSWKTDLFSDSPTVTLFSCSVGCGKDGDEFLNAMNTRMFQSRATIVAPTKTIYSVSRDIYSSNRMIVPKLSEIESPKEAVLIGLGHTIVVNITMMLTGINYLEKLGDAVPSEPNFKVLRPVGYQGNSD